MNKTDEIKSTRPTSIAFTSRCDIKSLATLAYFWRDKGEPARSVSELVRMSLETFRDVVLKQWPQYEIKEVTDALSILNRSNLTTGHRNRATLLKEMQIDEMVAEGLDPAYVSKQRTKAVPRHIVDEAIKRFEKEGEK